MKLIECPRDAMQGLHDFVPTHLKIDYINRLLRVGFDTLDFGSFVSPKAIPQMRDTAEVLAQLQLDGVSTKLLAIVANIRGAEEAASHEAVHYLGFPFSISETFQQRNTHSSIEQSLLTVDALLDICSRHNKTAVIYLSMGFGNPYGDVWNEEIVEMRASQLVSRGVKILSLADTTGMSTPEKIQRIVPGLLQQFKNTEIGVHLHSTPYTRLEKIAAAYEAGCRRFDSALMGFGGCPMAADELTGNMATEDLIQFLNDKGENLSLDTDKLRDAQGYARQIFM